VAEYGSTGWKICFGQLNSLKPRQCATHNESGRNWAAVGQIAVEKVGAPSIEASLTNSPSSLRPSRSSNAESHALSQIPCEPLHTLQRRQYPDHGGHIRSRPTRER